MILKINKRLVLHILFNLFYWISVAGQFEHVRLLEQFMSKPWHWWWSTAFPTLPHHMWWGTIGVYICYILFTATDFVVFGERLINKFFLLKRRVEYGIKGTTERGIG